MARPLSPCLKSPWFLGFITFLAAWYAVLSGLRVKLRSRFICSNCSSWSASSSSPPGAGEGEAAPPLNQALKPSTRRWRVWSMLACMGPTSSRSLVSSAKLLRYASFRSLKVCSAACSSGSAGAAPEEAARSARVLARSALSCSICRLSSFTAVASSRICFFTCLRPAVWVLKMALRSRPSAVVRLYVWKAGCPSWVVFSLVGESSIASSSSSAGISMSSSSGRM
mmetsp:Transcript_7175/g.14561  ORF Transcript_7175/g.14561 Transcript_7175/m.14561 type:complete len:225 (+) Transcript_7175:269-943(+)